MERNLLFEAFYEQPIERVWAALTSAEAMSAWLMPNDFLPIVGHRFQFRTKPAPGFDGIVNCQVLEIVPLSRLSYTWVGGGVDTKVIWTLVARNGGTNLTLEHRGFRGLRGWFVGSILSKGWKSRILSIRLREIVSRWDGHSAFPAGLIAECQSMK